MSQVNKPWSYEDREEVTIKIMLGVPLIDIAMKFNRNINSIEAERTTLRSFIKGKLYSGDEYQRAYDHLRMIFFKIMTKSIMK